MSPQYYVSSLEFSDGTKIDLQEGDFVLLIGPNNSGKSRALREMWDFTPGYKNASAQVVKQTDVHLTHGTEAVAKLVETLERTPGSPGHYSRMGESIQRESVMQNLENAPWMIKVLKPFLVRLLQTTERLNAANPASNINILRETKNHPFQYLYESEALELTVSQDFRRAFGVDVIVNHFAGSQVPLHIGDRSKLPVVADRLDPAYKQALSQLPLLHEQGDGMRSFVASILWARISDYRVLLIDEPEAFLHPPQARLLGNLVSKTKKATTQIIAASHSGDLLRGALDAGKDNLRIIRIVRDGDVNVARELPPIKLRELWADSLVRYSNLLDALFHRQCVICEGDADCQFYAAVLHAAAELKSDAPLPEAMFTSVNGKHRMPKAVRALKELNIDVRVVADFDVLREEQPLRSIYEALGGTWADIATQWKVVEKAVSATKAQLDTKDVKGKLAEVLGGVTTDYLPDQALKEIREITRKASAWGAAKAVGAQIVPAGDATVKYQSLIPLLAQKGMFVVPVGQLEGFDKTIGMHGPAWTGEVMQKDLAKDSTFNAAREFVQTITA